ncbi:Hypothetical predicted protein [Mytilus galloprovincialis]|uniref:TNFR-Cys domain-containing protein n=1 Tax=Mytilus galloprovincialis TaxID=29158 RepID=A0A8B6EDL5_MYTGA|nr:Hypothetical predicted protein [Mytilus galloprovincialis]
MELIFFPQMYSEVWTSNFPEVCRKCKAGFYVKEICDRGDNNAHDTICAKCVSGHFMSQNDHLNTVCTVCSVCAPGHYSDAPCSTISDTKCQSCDIEADTESFTTSCSKVPLANLNINGGGVKLDSLEEPGSGSDESFEVLPQNVSIINAELIASENETEGSGEVILDIPTSNQIVLEGKPPSSHNVSDEDLIPVSVNPTTIQKITTGKPPSFKNATVPSTTTTAKPTTGKPPSFKNATEPSTTTTVKSTTSAPVTTTTEKEKELDFGVGIKITEAKGDETNKEDNEENVYVPVQLDQPTTNPKDENKTPSRSAISKQKSAMTDDSDKVSIGIVIAVAIIAAIVFFVIGFIASKYCRRRRQSMKLMTKEQKNGGHHNGSIPVIDASNTYRSNGIYDEIGKEANGTCSSEKLDAIIPHHAVDNVYAIPDKRRKQVQQEDIKYIDETTDDESKEGDKLLGGNETEDDNEDVKTPNQNGDISVSGKPAVTTNETSPMLSEIQLEIENNTEPPKETDALVES